MDFKVAGTKDGITAIQMDLKNDGLKHEIVKEAFRMTREARFQILDEIMLKAIAEPRKELADSAPKMIQMKINPDKIREVIGSGGKIKDLEFKRTEKVEDVLKIGDMTWVKVMNVDDRGRIDLSRKDAMREKGLM